MYTISKKIKKIKSTIAWENVKHQPCSSTPFNMHHREHSVGLYHPLVQQLHRLQPHGSPEGGAVSTTA
jgi:hypothetical protein